MTRFQLFLSSLLLMTFTFSACEDSPTFRNRSKRIGQSVVGNIGELIVVCDDALWSSDLKAYLDTNLTQFIMPYYPDVPTFMLKHKTPKHFDKGVKRYRSLLFIQLDPNLKSDKVLVEKRKDIWALDQLVIDITAKNIEDLINFCKKGGLKSVHSELDYMEWKRIQNYFEENNNDKTNAKLAKTFGINLAMPEGTFIVNERPNFFRVQFPVANRPIEFTNAGSQDRGTILSGIMVYQYDYIDSSQFDFDHLIAARDTMLKYNAPYEVDGMYMGTQFAKLVYPEINTTTNYNNSISGIEMRGMFVFVGRPIYAPGGAFWSFSFKHPKRKKVVCVSGYLDAPSTASWTHQLREIQAVFKSVEFVD